jgi:hypothetical protein
MIQRTSGCLAVALGIALAAPLDAAAFDLASYLALTPGNWAIFQDTVSGEQSGYVTSQSGGQIVQTWYRFQGGAWVYDSAELYTVTSKWVNYVGSTDGTTTWLFEPVVSLRRKQSAGDSTVYKGVQRNQTTLEATPMTSSVSVADDKIGVTVPAGSFTGCIKLRVFGQNGTSSRDSVSISCPNRQEMKSWYNKLNDTGVKTDQESESHSTIAIQAGDSGSPIP